MREIIRTLIVVMFAATMLGCGGESLGPTGKVTGKLTLDGKQLPPGHAVSFMQMQKGFLAYGMTDAEGKFEVKSWNNGDMPVGNYDVMIAPPSSDVDDSQRSAEDRFENPQNADSSQPRVLFPAKYRETTTSGLQYEIKEGVNNFAIDLKSE
jgi:hypothetical protein